LTELKLNKARDAADATDSDYEEPTPAFRSVHNVTIDRNVSVVDNANNDDDDYDEPPEEVSSKVPAHEFEDYDEPIHHSSFASAGKF
jgi:hypothetical protein